MLEVQHFHLKLILTKTEFYVIEVKVEDMTISREGKCKYALLNLFILGCEGGMSGFEYVSLLSVKSLVNGGICGIRLRNQLYI